MATLNSYAYMTMAEAAKRLGYDAQILGELQQALDFLSEVPWMRATHGAYNKQLQASRLGVGAFAKANSPITVISSSTEEITEPVKLYEGDSIVDERVLATADNPTVVRDSEDMMNLRGAMQDWIYQLFYNFDYSTVDGFKSLYQRRRSLAANRCWGGSGTGGTAGSLTDGDTTDCWLIEFGPAAFYLAYGGNGIPGFQNEDRGRNLVTSPTGSGQMWAWVRHYSIYAAMVLRDDRAVQRYTNIESAGSSNIFDPAVFINAKNALPSVGRDAIAFVNRTIKAQIENNAYAKTNAAYSIRDIEGFGPVTMVAGVPLRLIESIPNTLGAVS